MTDPTAPLERSARSRALLPLIVVVALVVALLVPIVIHRSITSESLFAGGTFDRFPGERVEQQLGDDRPQVMIAYRQGEEYSFDFRLENESRWATRIVEFPGSGSGLLRRTSVDIREDLSGDDAAFTPFRPFTLESGEAVVVRITDRFEGCGSFVTIGTDVVRDVDIRHRTLWATRTDSVDLATVINVPVPEACPER
jgi:hypothetical protein